MAKYPYIVNRDGIWYPAGAEVPAGISENTEKSSKTEFTKTEINRMPTSELKKLAEEQGIEEVESKNGSELKRILIEKLGL